jgi:predicted dehydrogenase
MDGFEFAVVGAGWRTDFFLRVAAALPQMKLCGVVARSETRAKEIESDWAVPCYASIADLMQNTRPSFVISSVSAEAMPAVCIELAGHAVPILAETPPATDLEGLVNLYQQISKLGARIQVAEQYWAQPMHAARQAVVDSGILGPINQVNLSVCHGYHAMSLIRRLLGIGFEPATICLLDMQCFVEEGRSFYSLEEASQDQYLALACTKAIETGDTVQTEAQMWASQS